MLQNPRQFENSPNLLMLFVKITKFLQFSKKITKKTIVFLNSETDLSLGISNTDLYYPDDHSSKKIRTSPEFEKN